MYKSNNKIGFLRTFLITVSVGLSFGILTQAHAQWKWLDANGITHYTDTAPPASVPHDKILSWPAGANKPGRIQTKQPDSTQEPTGKTSNPAEMDEATKKLEEQRKRIEDEKKRVENENKAKEDYQRQRACESAQQAVNRYASGMRIRDMDDKGEYYYLSDAEIKKRNDDATGKVAEYCK